MSLKDKRNVNMFYLLFCSSCYQLICVFALFWTDILPKFGYTDNIHEFGEKYAKYTNQTACYRRCLSLSSSYKYGLSCFFGGSGCTYVPGLRGTVFITMYTISYIGGGLLLRYAEGATYLAVVNVSMMHDATHPCTWARHELWSDATLSIRREITGTPPCIYVHVETRCLV